MFFHPIILIPILLFIGELLCNVIDTLLFLLLAINSPTKKIEVDSLKTSSIQQTAADPDLPTTEWKIAIALNTPMIPSLCEAIKELLEGEDDVVKSETRIAVESGVAIMMKFIEFEQDYILPFPLAKPNRTNIELNLTLFTLNA